MRFRQKEPDKGVSGKAPGKICKYCGKRLEVFKRKASDGARRQLTITLMCECVRQEKKRQQKRCQVQNMMHILAIRGFQTGKYARMTMENWRNVNMGVNVIEQAEEYIDSLSLNNRNWLYMYGNHGVGKTHIAVASTRKIAIERNLRPALLRWAEYCGLIQQSWRDESIKPDWNLTRNAQILVLDDIDKKDATPWTMSKLYDVVDYRCIHNLPTIITANRGIADLSKFWSREKKSEDLSKAIISRILGQVLRVIPFTGEDYRLLAE